MSLNRNIFYNFLTQIPALMLGVGSGIFLTRILGANGRGAFTIFQSDIELFTLFLSFSLGSGLTYFISVSKIPLDRLMGIGIFFWLSGLSLLSVFLVAFKLFSAGSFVFPGAYNSWYYVLYLVIGFGLSFFNAIISAVFQGRAMFRQVNIILLVNASCNFVFFCIAFLFCRSGMYSFHLKHVLAISLAIMVINSILWTVYYIRLIGTGPVLSFSMKDDLSPLLRFVGISHISHVINFMNYRLDVWIVEHFKGIEQLGYYSLAANAAQMFWLFSNPVVTVLTPYLPAQNEQEKNETFTLFSRLTFTVVLALMVVAFFVAGLVLPFVYGPDFVHSVTAFRILLPGILFSCLTKIFGVYIYSTGKIQYNLIATFIGFVFTVALDLLLIPRIGITGASIASSVSYCAICITVSFFLFVALKVQPGNYYLLMPADLKRLRTKFNVFISSAK